MGDTQFSLVSLAIDAYVLARNSNVNFQQEAEKLAARVGVSAPKTQEADQVSLQRKEVARIGNLEPTQSNVRQNLTILLTILKDIYKKRNDGGDPALARECQLTAIKYVTFVYEKMNPEPFVDLASSLGIFIPTKVSRSQKATHVASQAVNNPGHTLGKIWENIGTTAHRPEYASGKVELAPTGNQLSDGVESYALILNGEKIGEVLMVPEKAAVSASYQVYSDQDYAGYNYGENTKDFILFTSANYSSNFVDNIPATLSIVDGVPRNLFVSPQMHGLVTVENGRPRVSNLKLNPPLPIISGALAPGSNISLFQSNLIVDGGHNVVPDQESSATRDKRRVLVTGTEPGRFGIVQVSSFVDLHELGNLVARLPNIGSAVNLDTGGCDLAGYRATNGSFTWLGDVNASSITLFGVRSNSNGPKLAAR